MKLLAFATLVLLLQTFLFKEKECDNGTLVHQVFFQSFQHFDETMETLKELNQTLHNFIHKRRSKDVLWKHSLAVTISGSLCYILEAVGFAWLSSEYTDIYQLLQNVEFQNNNH